MPITDLPSAQKQQQLIDQARERTAKRYHEKGIANPSGEAKPDSEDDAAVSEPPKRSFVEKGKGTAPDTKVTPTISKDKE